MCVGGVWCVCGVVEGGGEEVHNVKKHGGGGAEGQPG